MIGRAACLVAALLGAAAAGAETPVDVELVVAVDVSSSMDPDEQRLQRDGYVAALRDPDIAALIGAGPHGKIVLAYVEWADPGHHALRVPWRLIEDEASARAFADELDRTPISRFDATSISAALAFAASLFEANGYRGQRRVIDVSGDGPNNTGAPVEPARDALVAQGIVINGLPLMLKPWGPAWAGVPGMDAYYRACVIGGPGSFVVPVREPGEMAAAIRQKLALDIAGAVPGVVPVAVRSPLRFDCRIGERLRD